MANFITYQREGNMLPLRQWDAAPARADYRYCVRFDDWDKGLAAWVADANVRQAIRSFGGVEVYGELI